MVFTKFLWIIFAAIPVLTFGFSFIKVKKANRKPTRKEILEIIEKSFVNSVIIVIVTGIVIVIILLYLLGDAFQFNQPV